MINTEKGNISGKGPCNAYSSAYDLYGEQLKLSSIVSTEMACEQLPQEKEYFDALQKVTGYKIKNSRMFLYNGDSVIAEFIKSE